MKAQLFNSHDICSEKWNQLLKNSRQFSPYLLYNYIEIITHQHWQAIIIVQKNGDYMAALPLEIKKKWHLKYSIQSKFAQNWGIFMKDKESEKAHSFWSHRRKVQQLILAVLEDLKLSAFQHHFHASFDYLLPFHWAKYEITARYNFLLPLKNKNDQLTQLSSSTRRILKKEEAKKWKWEQGDFDSLVEKLENPLKGEKKQLFYNKSDVKLIKKLFLMFTKEKQALLLNLKDEMGESLADGLFFMIEKQCYYLFGGQSSKGKKQNAMTHLLWEAICISGQNACQTFNFEGSMEASIERFFRGFGAYPTCYFKVSKQNSILIKTWTNLKS